ncbi:hypothetical protein Tco_0658359 [Tanacetum coccineum]
MQALGMASASFSVFSLTVAMMGTQAVTPPHCANISFYEALVEGEVLPEHPSDTKVLTMKMKILLKPTSNKLLVVDAPLSPLYLLETAPLTLLVFVSPGGHSGLRTASAAAKHVQGDLRNFYSDSQACKHAGPKVTTLHGGNTTTRMIKRFTMADDLKESSKITQINETKLKDHYIMYKEINA